MPPLIWQLLYKSRLVPHVPCTSCTSNHEGTLLTWHTIIAPSCSNTSENTSLNLWGYRWYCWRIGVLILSYLYERWLQRVVNTRMYCVLFEQGLWKAQGKSRKVSTTGLYVWTQHWECMTNGEKLQEVHASKPCYLACTNGYLNATIYWTSAILILWSNFCPTIWLTQLNP